MSKASILARTAARKALGLDQTYSRHVGKAQPRHQLHSPMKRTALPLCVHEGRVLERCGTCGSGSRHVRACTIHGKCSHIETGRPDVQVCDGCSDRRFD